MGCITDKVYVPVLVLDASALDDYGERHLVHTWLSDDEVEFPHILFSSSDFACRYPFNVAGLIIMMLCRSILNVEGSWTSFQ